MDDNFSSRVKDVITFSKEEALRLGHDFIGTEHLMLGILRDGEGKAIEILNSAVEKYSSREYLEDILKAKAEYFELTGKISDDDVVRMTLLAVSPKGSNNLTHEGFRCSTGEYKLYATAWGFNSDWMPMKNPLWLVTNKKNPSRYRYDLLESYICSGRIIFEGQEELRLRFKKGKLAKPRDRGRI